MRSKSPTRPGTSRAQASSTAVAKLAGVSQATVSRVFNGGAVVSDEVRERVLSAAAELRYQPNALPRILQTGRSGIIAVVIGGLYNPFYTEFLRHVTPLLRAQGHEVMLVDTESDDRFEGVVGELSRYRIDGVISALAVRSPSVARRLESINVPVVSINSRRYGHIRTVSADNRPAAALAADLLVDAGCRRPLYLAGRENPSQIDRERGFQQRLAERGLPGAATVTAGFSYEEGYASAMQALSARERPDGIFCVNDLVAMGAMDAARTEFGLSVPGDIQVIGFDDIPQAAWAAYSLTTFRQDIGAFARGCVELLAEDATDHSIRLVPELVTRRSTVAAEMTA